MSGTKLDDATERLIEDLTLAALDWGECEDDPLIERNRELATDAAQSALRDRVRELVEQARDEGFIDGQHKLAEIMRPSR